MKFLLSLSLIFLFACSAAQKPYPSHTQQAITQAERQGFTLQRYQTKTFLLTSYAHVTKPTENKVHIYVEGDGHSWKTRYQLSDNPTPHQATALKLAMRDKHANVVYIARPCQYTPLNLDQHCDAKYWSSHRYAAEVVASFNEVLDNIKILNKNTNYVLIGFSGGASIATLLAAQRKDVVGLITVAGDLDHELLQQHHHTTPLSGSLNPSKVAHKLKAMPQHHLVGEKDKIVPPWLAQHFAQKVNNPECLQITTLKGVSHHTGWEKKWEDLVQQALSTCSSA